MLQGPDGAPVPVSVWTSTLQRTILTAAGLPFAKLKWKALDEIDAGICDGMTYAQVRTLARTLARTSALHAHCARP
jgi:broad specificity phosphatase PhoE